jgi:hypothetical protein
MFQVEVFWVVNQWSVVVRYQGFGEICCLHLQDENEGSKPEDLDSNFLTDYRYEMKEFNILTRNNKLHYSSIFLLMGNNEQTNKGKWSSLASWYVHGYSTGRKKYLDFMEPTFRRMLKSA